MKISVNGISREYEAKDTFYHAALDISPDKEIYLFREKNKIHELMSLIPDRDMELIPIGEADPEGHNAYIRTALFIMLKACRDLLRKEIKTLVKTSLGDGYYCFFSGGFLPEAGLIEKIEKRMQEIVRNDLRIWKHSLSIEEAREYFQKEEMHEKDRLFSYRIFDRVNLYELDGYMDYFYGEMLPTTGFIKVFRLIPYEEGFIIQLPNIHTPGKLSPYTVPEGLFRVQEESRKWAENIGALTVGSLNEIIAKRGSDQLILMTEAIFEKRIGDIAGRIFNENKKVVLIAGPSSSGKTSFSRRLSIQLSALGLKPHPISVDNYFKNREMAPRDEKGNYDFESIECVDLDLFNRQMKELLDGKTIEMPRYNFLTGRQEFKGDYMTLKPGEVLIIEGIHCLNDRMSEGFSRDSSFKIYVSALTPMNIDCHNRIPTSDNRLIRRIVRDFRTRGYSAEETIKMWSNVRRGEEKNIFPYQEKADVMMNTSLIYELGVLKIYASPLLFQIEEDNPAYPEARRLLKFMEYFLPLSPELIPNNSLIREFIGGSCLDVG